MFTASRRFDAGMSSVDVTSNHLSSDVYADRELVTLYVSHALCPKFSLRTEVCLMTMIVISIQTNTMFLYQQNYYWVHPSSQSESG